MTLLSVICFEDMKYRKIYNKRVLFLLGLLCFKFCFGLLVIGEPIDFHWYGLIIYLAISAGLILLGSLGLIGMGDVKLIMIIMPFIGVDNYMDFLFYMTVVGGILAVIQLVVLNRMFEFVGFSSKGVPYAIPIIASYVMHSTILFR
ncbi:prepilin peptidase [Vibrio azureus]|nr:prepilin peptidase [Vibrio azureus]